MGNLNVVGDALSRRAGTVNPQVAYVEFYRFTFACASRSSRSRITFFRCHLCRGGLVNPLFLLVHSQFQVGLSPDAKHEMQQGYHSCLVSAHFGAVLYPTIANMSRRATSCLHTFQTRSNGCVFLPTIVFVVV